MLTNWKGILVCFFHIDTYHGSCILSSTFQTRKCQATHRKCILVQKKSYPKPRSPPNLVEHNRCTIIRIPDRLIHFIIILLQNYALFIF